MRTHPRCLIRDVIFVTVRDMSSIPSLRRALLVLLLSAPLIALPTSHASAQSLASLTGCTATYGTSTTIDGVGGGFTIPATQIMWNGTIEGELRLLDPATGKQVTQVEQGATILIAIDYLATSYDGNVFTPHGEFAVSDGKQQLGEKLKINDIASVSQHTGSTGWTYTANALGTQTITATLGVANTYEGADYGSEWIPGDYTLACSPGMTLSLSAQVNVVPAKPGVRAISLLPSKGVSGGSAKLKYRIEGTRKPTQERIALLTMGGKILKRETSKLGKNPGSGRTTYVIGIPKSIKAGRYVWCVSTRAQGTDWSDYKCAALTVT